MAFLQSVVSAPGNNTAGTNPIAPCNPDGAPMFSEVHGKWYSAARAGRVYIATSLIAGITIPVNTTTSPTWTLFNPATSTVNLELIHFDVGSIVAATLIQSEILGSISKQTPTSTTALTPANIINPMSSGSPQASMFTAATIGAAITTHMPLFLAPAVAVAAGQTKYEFDGKVVLPPGWLFTVTSTPVQSGVLLPSLSWAEWPV